MTKKYNISLSGRLTTKSPICIVPPNSSVQKYGGGSYSETFKRTVFEENGSESRPAVPGSTLRGRLRRSATKIVIAGLEAKKMSLAEFHQNAVGGVKGAEKEDAFDVVLRAKVRKLNPILALFGAGAPWMSSHVFISDAIPTEPVNTEVVGGTRADDGRRDDGLFELLDENASDDWRSLIAGNSARSDNKKKEDDLKRKLMAARKAGDKVAEQGYAADLTVLRSEKGAEAKTNAVSMPLLHEAMPAGVPLESRIELRGVTKAEAGLFFAALNHFFGVSPAIGQHRNVGYGLLEGVYDVKVLECAGPADFDPFSLAGEFDGDAAGVFSGEVSVTPYVGLAVLKESSGATFVRESIAEFKKNFVAGEYDFSLAGKYSASDVESEI